MSRSPLHPSVEEPGQLTEIGLRPAEWVVAAVLGVVVGLGLAGGLPWLIGLAGSLEWFPFSGQLLLAGRVLSEVSVARTLSWFLLPLVGAVAGVVLCTHAVTLQVADRELVVHEDGKRRRFARSQVDRVVLAGRRMSVRDAADADLCEVKLDVEPDRVVEALERRGWSVERS